MNESFAKNFSRLGSGQEESQKHPDVVDVSAVGKVRAVDSDPISQYSKIYHKIMMEFGYKMLKEKKSPKLGDRAKQMFGVLDSSTADLIARIDGTKEADWSHHGREALFEAITDEIYLRLWPTRQGSKRNSKTADIVPFK